MTACQIPGHTALDMRVPMPSRGVIRMARGSLLEADLLVPVAEDLPAPAQIVEARGAVPARAADLEVRFGDDPVPRVLHDRLHVNRPPGMQDDMTIAGQAQDSGRLAEPALGSSIRRGFPDPLRHATLCA
jgi:hypothetical protein